MHNALRVAHTSRIEGHRNPSAKEPRNNHYTCPHVSAVCAKEAHACCGTPMVKDWWHHSWLFSWSRLPVVTRWHSSHFSLLFCVIQPVDKPTDHVLICHPRPLLMTDRWFWQFQKKTMRLLVRGRAADLATTVRCGHSYAWLICNPPGFGVMVSGYVERWSLS